MIDLDDQDLLERSSAGDRGAFDELMRRHEDRVFAVCLRVLRQREAALDAVQDTFLTVFRKADQFRGESRFSTWLYRVAVNTCYDQLGAVELRPGLSAALAGLSEEFRSAIVLTDVEGLPVAEVAEILEVPEGTVKSRLHRGRRELARILGNREAWG